jgi:hypothetical protein
MITGRSSGTGKYSYHERSSANNSVMVSHMPDDGYKIRIAFRNNGEVSLPLIKIGEREAEMLWAALNGMAKDLNWKDMSEES